MILGIHVEDPNRRPADSRLPSDVDAAPLEVVFPTMPSRMKQFCDPISFRINARQMRAFVEIAIDTGESPIFQFVRASMYPRNNVLDVQHGQRRVVLAQQTILTTMPGALLDAGSLRRVHLLRLRANDLPRPALENGDKLVGPHVPLVFGPFCIRE